MAPRLIHVITDSSLSRNWGAGSGVEVRWRWASCGSRAGCSHTIKSLAEHRTRRLILNLSKSGHIACLRRPSRSGMGCLFRYFFLQFAWCDDACQIALWGLWAHEAGRLGLSFRTNACYTSLWQGMLHQVNYTKNRRIPVKAVQNNVKKMDPAVKLSQ